jgi:uncharacterized RDD family membrane protein YckC
MQRFDEIELQAVPMIEDVGALPPPVILSSSDAPRFRRLLALLIDLSLFVALSLALSPLLPATRNIVAIIALAGFVLMTSYYYFVGTWLLWGKTIGCAIFDVRVVSDQDEAMSLKAATMRWLALLLSLLTAGVGLAFAILPSRRSLPDRLSGTHCMAAA